MVWCRADPGPRAGAGACIVNAGNANVFTGAAGDEAVRAEARRWRAALGCAPEEVFMASTGVIGEPLDRREDRRGVPALIAGLRARTAGEPRRARS